MKTTADPYMRLGENPYFNRDDFLQGSGRDAQDVARQTGYPKPGDIQYVICTEDLSEVWLASDRTRPADQACFWRHLPPVHKN